jgi:predicted aminopeptidase
MPVHVQQRTRRATVTQHAPETAWACRRRWRHAVLWVGLAGTLSGCGLTGLAAGQLELINGQTRLERALVQETDPTRRALLREVPAVRRFAEEVVGMAPGRSHTGYFSTSREGMTYVLSASEQTRLRAYTWWFPVAGRVEYRSYFDRQDADRAAHALQARGYDTWIAPSRAYSTLGFFRDPVSTTMMRQGLTSFVEVLLHEMAHARLYVPGQTAWNEALATLVGQQAALRYFEQPRFAGTVHLARMRDQVATHAERAELAARAAQQLTQLYERGASVAQVLSERQRIFDDMQRTAAKRWPSADPRITPSNNAQLLHALRYGQGNQELRTLWQRSRGHFRTFWALAEAHTETLQ